MKFKNIICFLIILLPKIVFGQQFFRIEGDFTIKEKTDNKAQLIIGRFYYDKNIDKLVYNIKFPEPQIYVFKDTQLLQFVADTLYKVTSIANINKLTIFSLALNNNINNFGLEKTIYKLENVEKENDMIISTWIPRKKFNNLFGKILLSTKNNKLTGVIFFNKEDKIIMKQFFEDYQNFKGLDFPTKIIKILYVNEKPYYHITTFEKIKVNNTSSNFYYDYPIPIK